MSCYREPREMDSFRFIDEKYYKRDRVQFTVIGYKFRSSDARDVLLIGNSQAI